MYEVNALDQAASSTQFWQFFGASKKIEEIRKWKTALILVVLYMYIHTSTYFIEFECASNNSFSFKALAASKMASFFGFNHLWYAKSKTKSLPPEEFHRCECIFSLSVQIFLYLTSFDTQLPAIHFDQKYEILKSLGTALLQILY